MAPEPVTTETVNPRTTDIDLLPTLELVERINQEDQQVALAVRPALPVIARAIDAIADRLRAGGRLIYLGAGTSGRLAMLDAAECPPTFSTPPDQVIARIAGGPAALLAGVEGAEDDREAGAREVASLNVTAQDAVVGIAASGRTPYVIGGLWEARKRGALTISLSCNHPAALEEPAGIRIHVLTGAEVIAGSTRMKAGTAQKMVLNMLSTGVMIRLNKTYGNRMVDVQATNHKLRERARRMLAEICALSEDDAAVLLERCHGQVKPAVVCALAQISPEEARRLLDQYEGSVRRALASQKPGQP